MRIKNIKIQHGKTSIINDMNTYVYGLMAVCVYNILYLQSHQRFA